MKNTLLNYLMKTTLSKAVVILSFILIGPIMSTAQTNFVSWDFTPSISSANYATSTTNQNGAKTSALTSPTLSTISINGSGVSGVGANTFHRTTGWPTSSSSSKYLEFSITLGSSQTFSNDTFNLAIIAAVSTTTTAARDYTVTYGYGASPSFSTVSGSNSAASNTRGGTVTSIGTSSTSNTATIPAPGNTIETILTIRILIYGSSSSSGNFRIYSLALTSPSNVINTTPIITLAGTPNDFTTSAINTTSSEQSFTVSGSNLTDSVRIAPPTGFEISTGTGGSFVAKDTVRLANSSGTLSSTTIYVRYKPTSLSIQPQASASLINASSSGATAKTIIVTGSVRNLSQGDIAVIGFNASTTDAISFVALVDIAANTVIKFTDNGYSDATTQMTGEGFLIYTAPSTISMGTVVSWSNGMSISGTGWNSNNPSNFSLSALGEQLFAYQGTWAVSGGTTNLLEGFNNGNSGWTASGSNLSATSNSYQPSALSTGAMTFFNPNGFYSNNTGNTVNTKTNIYNRSYDSTNWTRSAAQISTVPSWSFVILADEPTLNVSSGSIAFTGTTNNSITATWTNPVANGGAKRIVVLRLSATSAVAPTDNTIYTATSTFGSGTGLQLTGTGNYVIYNGTGTIITVSSGINPSTAYAVDIYEYNGGTGSLKENYLGTAGTAGTTTFNSTVLADITQPTGSITQGVSDIVLSGFSITPSSNIDFTAVTVTTSGTATSTDITSVRIFRDNDGNGAINGADSSVSGAGATYAGSINFSISGETNFPTAHYYLIVTNVAGAGTSTAGNTVTASISSGNYTTNAYSSAGTANGNSRTIAAPPGTSTITAGAGTEPTTISSIINSQGTSSLNFDIDILDDGATPANDNVATQISQMVFNQGSGNTVSDWSIAIAGAELSDGTNNMTGTINSSNITFSSISNSSGNLGYVADDSTKTYTLKVWLKTNMTTLKNTIDGQRLVFKILSNDVTLTVSQLASGQDQNSGSSKNLIDVAASALTYIQNTSNAIAGIAMSPAITVSAIDANGNRDLDFTSQIRITSSGSLSGTQVDAAASSGVATFSTLTHTAVATGIALNTERTSTLDWDISSNTFDISPSNDDCSGATTLTVNATAIAGTSLNATQSISAISCNSNTSSGTIADVWYKFTATTTSHTITVTPGASYNAVVDVRSGSCNSSNVNCADANGAGGVEKVNLTGLMVSSVYYIRIYHFGGGSSSTPTFNVKVESPTVLSIGDISIIGFNSNTPDNFSFVTWVDLVPNTIIKFTDNGFLSTSSSTTTNNGRGGENFVTWTNSSGNNVAAGTVIKIEDGASPSVGSVSQTLNGISASGDQIFAYQGSGAGTSASNSDWGTNTNPSTVAGTMLFGLTFPANWISTGSASSNTSYLPSDLNVSNGNIAIASSGATSGQYTGSRANQPTLASYKSLVTNTSNWTIASSGTSTLSTTAFTTSTTSTLGNITQPTGPIYQGYSSEVLSGFTVTPNAAVDFTGVTVTRTGTATSTDITAVRIIRDYNGDGIINTTSGVDSDVSVTPLSYANSMAFTITGETGFSSVRNYLIVGNVAAIGTSTVGRTLATNIASGAFTTTGSTTPATINTGSETGNTRTISLPPGTGTISAGGGSEPATISSVVNSQGASSLNFDFTIQDDGATSSTDTLSSYISQMIFNQGTGNTVTDWSLAIAGAELSDGSNTLTGTINSTNITFSSISNNYGDLGHIADDSSKTYTLKVWLNSDMTTLKNTIAGLGLVFRIKSSDITANVGSQLTAVEDQNSGSTNNVINVAASQLAYIQNATNVYTNYSMSPAVKVKAIDANNNLDLNFAAQIRITSTGTLAGTTIDTFAVAGIATYSTLTHTAIGATLTLKAQRTLSLDWDATSSTFNVTDAPAIAEVIFPQYAINGNTAGSRFPYTCRLSVNNLTPNATYKYTVAGSTATSLSANGAGNMFAIYNSTQGSAGYLVGYSSGKSFGSLASEFSSNEFTSSSRYATLTTDSSGSYTGWFSLVPTGNAVFTAGNDIYFYVQMNNGTNAIGDSLITQSLHSTNTIRMLDYTTGLPMAGTSHTDAENFAFVYDNTAGSGRPIYGSWTENDGITTTFTTWYTSAYDGVGSAWASIIPSSLSNGIRRIGFYNNDGTALYAVTSTNGTWGSTNTVNHAAGTTPIVIGRTATGTSGDYINYSASSLNSNLTVNGDLTLTSGTLDINTDSLFITGTVSRTTGNINASNGIVAFTNTSALSLPSNTFTGNVKNIYMNGSGGVTINSPITFSNKLTFNSGQLHTGSDSVIMTNTGSIIETNSSNIQGKLYTLHTLTQNVKDTFGGLGLYITETTQSSNNYVVTRVTGTPITSGNSGAFNGHQGIKRYYTINPTTNTNLSAQVTFKYFDGELNGITESGLRIYTHPDPYTNGNWADLGGRPALNITNNTITNDPKYPVSHFSTWSFSSEAEALPVELVNLAGTIQNSVATIKWMAANEDIGSLYEIRHGTNIYHTSAIGTQTAFANGETANYQLVHHTPAMGTNYYQLWTLQVDGTSRMLGQIALENKGLGHMSYSPMQLYPNPTNSNLQITFGDMSTVANKLQIVNQMGAIVSEQTLNGSNSTLLDVSHLAFGVYHILIYGNNGEMLQGQRFIKN